MTVVAERDAHGHLAAGSGRGGCAAPGPPTSPTDEDVRRDAQPVVGLEAPVLRVDPDRLQAEAVEGHVAPDRTAGPRGPRPRRAVSSSTDVAPSARRRPARTRVARAPSRSVDAVALAARRRASCRAARVVLVVDPVSRMDEGDRHAVAGVDLRQLDAGRARRRGSPANAGSSRVDVPSTFVHGCASPRPGRSRGTRLTDPTARMIVPASRTRSPTRTRPGPSSVADPRIDRRAGSLQALHVAGVVWRIGSFAVDHVVAEVRRLRPRIVAATVVDGRGVEQRLRGHARPERA